MRYNELIDFLQKGMVRKMLEGQKCLVIGSGISGIGAVDLLEKYHADVVLYDSSDKLTKEDLEASGRK